MRLISQTKQLKPPLDLTPSEWADRYRFLSPEDSAEPGKYRVDRAPYQRGILDALKTHQRVVLMCSAQVGKTLCQTNALGYWIDQSPGPILWISPTVEMAESTSKEKIAPMVRDSPRIKELVEPTQSRKSGNTILQKKFPGGQLTLAGANSPASLASRSIRYLLLDEIDRYPPSAGTEGDPMKLAEVRTKAFWNSRIFAVSTPTVKGASRIEKEFELSDRRHFYVPCPHCGHYQWLKWDGLTYEGKGTSAYKLGATDWLGYLCEVCGEIIEEKFKSTILSQGEWRSHAESRTAGFHLNELCSPFSSWRDMALAYEEARQEPQTYRVWFNTALGLPLEEDNREQGSWESLLPRVSDSSYQMGQVPEGALLLTSGVDVQADRLECAVFGWGEGEQSWLIDYQVFLGDPQGEEVWEALQLFLEKDYNHPLGQSVRVKLAAVDTGFLTPEVYIQILKRRTWVAVKGRAGDRPLITPPTLQEVNVRGKKIRKGIKLYLLGVDQAKSVLLGRAKIQAVGPRHINLPADIDHDWIKGFVSSEVKVKKFKGGLPYYTWEPVTGQRNEPLDCAVYAYAGAAIAGLSRINWEKVRQSLKVQEPQPKPEPEPPPRPPVDPRPNRRSGKQSKNWFTSH